MEVISESIGHDLLQMLFTESQAGVALFLEQSHCADKRNHQYQNFCNLQFAVVVEETYVELRLTLVDRLEKHKRWRRSHKLNRKDILDMNLKNQLKIRSALMEKFKKRYLEFQQFQLGTKELQSARNQKLENKKQTGGRAIHMFSVKS